MKVTRLCKPLNRRGEAAVVSLYPSSLRHGPSAYAVACELFAWGDGGGLDLALRLDDGDQISIAIAQSVVDQLRDALREIDSRQHAQTLAHERGLKCAERCTDCSGR